VKILIVTTEWPRFEGDSSGIHVVNQINFLRRVGVLVDVFPFRGRKNPLAYRRARRDLNRIDLDQYDIIHAHHGQSGLVALSQDRRPVVVTFHGTDLQGIRDRRGRVTPLGYVLRFSSRWVAAHANEVILVSAHLARFLPKDIAYQVIPAGIDLSLFRPIPMADARLVLGLPRDARLVLFVGNPERTEKRFSLAQRAVASLKEMPAVQLVIANNVPLEKMPLYMNACDALLLTSSSEGSPNAVKEALACNLPVVSTDVGDVRQRVGTLDGCRVCPDDQPESLTQALRQILESHGRIQGRQAVLDMDEGMLVRKVIAVYEKATRAPS